MQPKVVSELLSQELGPVESIRHGGDPHVYLLGKGAIDKMLRAKGLYKDP